MKTDKVLSGLSTLAICAILLVGSCTKDAANKSASGPSLNDETVVTPFGVIAKEKVYQIQPGNALNVKGNHVTEINRASGEVVMDFGENPEKKSQNSNLRVATNGPNFSNGIIVDYVNSFATGYTYFASNFSVPTAPTQVNAETLFYGNFAFFNEGTVVSALQYGGSAAGGGEYWALTNWYFDNAGNVSFQPLSTSIAPGISLQSIISLSNGVWTAAVSGYSNGLSISGLTISQSNNPVGIYFGGYPKNAGAYPAQIGLRFTNVVIKAGSTTMSGINWLDGQCGASGIWPVNQNFATELRNPNWDCNPCELDMAYGSVQQPTNVSFVGSGSYPATLNWTACAGAVSYDIGYSVQTANSNLINAVGSSTSNSYVFPFSNGQYCGAQLSAVVRANYGGITSAWSCPEGVCCGGHPVDLVTIQGPYTAGTTLTFRYASGQFSVSSNYPIADPLTIGGFVAGYTGTTCTGGIVDSDSFSASMAPCSQNFSVVTNGLSCIDKRYKFNYATINGNNYGNGATVTVNGHAYKVVIIGSTCSAYPC
jgi:hypothetical protein